MLPPGRSPLVIPGRLLPHEVVQAQRIVAFYGGTFTGAATRRGFPGIDGTLDGVAVSLKRYTGSSLVGVLRHASTAEAQAMQADFTGVEVFIEARNVRAGPLLDFARTGGLSQIP